MGDYEKAIRKYQDYIDLTPTIAAADKAEVERTIQDLLRKKEEMLPELTIASKPRGADIFIDNPNKIRGQTPGKFRIDPGPHQIFLERKGFERVEKSFVMPSGKPLMLDFEMQPTEEFGSAQIVANVAGARVFIDGKNVGITPYSEMPSLKIGFNQFILEKEGFLRWEQRVEVGKGRTTLVTADLVRIQAPSSAPPVLGWTSLVLGGLCLGGGAVANYFADQKFNDTKDFKTMHDLTLTGYIGGGVLLTTAVTLLVYSMVRDDPRDAAKGEYYGLSGTPRTQFPLLGFGLDPVHRTLTLGAGLSF